MSLRIVATPLRHEVRWPEPGRSGVPTGLLEAILPAPAAGPLLAKLRDPDTVVVTTGQQPGLFTGPLYTLHKALSSAALAAELEARWRRPVQAVFWVAGDDHDFREANRTAWLDAAGSLREVTLRDRPEDAPLTPMYRERLGDAVVDALATLEGDLPVSEFRDEVLGWLGRHYRPEATVARSFGAALAELVAPHGVACLDSSHRAVKEASIPCILSALRAAPDLNRALAARAAALSGAGKDPGVPVSDEASLVMVEAAAGRDRLLLQGGTFRTRRSGEDFTLAALEDLAVREPARLSPNVLLRPVAESAILPTVAYVAGPGELRYLELATVVYEALEVRRQLPVPRWSGLLVEPRVDRVLGKFGAELAELLAPAGQLEARVVRSQMPPAAGQAFGALREAFESAYATLEGLAVDIDPTLRKPVQNARHHAIRESEELEKKLVQHLKRRHEVEMAQIDRARTLVAPNGHPQERVLNPAPFLARHGFGLVEELAGTVRAWYAAALERAPAPA